MAVMSDSFDWESLQFLDQSDHSPILPHATAAAHTYAARPTSSDASNSRECSFSAHFINRHNAASASASTSFPETSASSSLPEIVQSRSNSPSSVRANGRTALELGAQENYLHTGGATGHNRTFSDVSVSSSVSEARRSSFSPVVQLPKRGRPPTTGGARRTGTSATRRKPSPSINTEAPPGTILLYSSAGSVQNDRPVAVGSLDRGKMAAYAAADTAKITHFKIAETIRKEFAAEDGFRRMLQGRRGRQRNGRVADFADAEYYETARINKRRRLQGTGCEWRPESVYKTYVDCKPHFFDQSDYQDSVPEVSCFGKINMRIPKAWTRGPNRKRARYSNHYRSHSGPVTVLPRPELNLRTHSQPPMPQEPEIVQHPAQPVHVLQSHFEAHQANIQAQHQVQQMAYAVPDENEDFLLDSYLFQNYRG